jgi:hypothetical protein
MEHFLPDLGERHQPRAQGFPREKNYLHSCFKLTCLLLIPLLILTCLLLIPFLIQHLRLHALEKNNIFTILPVFKVRPAFISEIKLVLKNHDKESGPDFENRERATNM